MQLLDLSDRQDFVVICGDIHGEFESIVHEITVHRGIQNAIVIVAGDCGFGFNKIVYYDTLYEHKLHKKLEQANVFMLMVRGNHDDPLFFDKEIIDYPYMKTLPDYTIIHTTTHNILCVGGAISTDRNFRLSMMDIDRLDGKKKLPIYWPDEPFRYDEAELQVLEDESIKIDTVVTHSSPYFCPPYRKDGLEHFCANDENLADDIKRERTDLTKLYQWLTAHKHPLKNWFYGHYHFTETTPYESTTFHLLNINELTYSIAKAVI